MKAIWNDQIIAESDNTIVLEGNHYFPADSIKKEFFSDNPSQTTCPWKGVASYYNIQVGGATNQGAAWYYQSPKDAAAEIKNHVAFWKGVEITE